MTKQEAAGQERLQLIAQEMAEHESNMKTELTRHWHAIDHIQDVYLLLRIGE